MSRARVVSIGLYVILPLLAALVIVLIIVSANTRPALTSTQPALPLVNRFDKSPNTFQFDYPEGWQYAIPLSGVLVLGPPATLYDAEPGPTFTVQRTTPLSVAGGLEAALNAYLERGPLRDGAHWTITKPVTSSAFKGRRALIIELQGSDYEDGIPLHSRILATSSGNTFVYLFITTTPVESMTAYQPTLNAILESVVILE